MEQIKIFASIIDEATKKQIDEMSVCDAYKDCTVRIMPDCHAGSGCTIGSVIMFNDRIVPNTVGVDIGCGMLVVGLGNIDIDLHKLDEVINKYVPSGFNVHEEPHGFFPEIEQFHAEITKEDYLIRSIGTLGGGNHFIEIDADDNGKKYLVIHTGSRNLGVQVCNFWQQVGIDNLTDDSNVRRELIERLKAEGRQKEIGEELKKIKRPQINKDLAYIEGQDLLDYLHDMKLCQDYAMLNRFVIADTIMKHMGWEVREEQFTTIHNYIDIENKIIRKGSISAREGEWVIIPMNMRDGSLLCRGKGNRDWLWSAPHGAGRIMSRAQAMKNLSVDDFEKSMYGIYSTSVCKETLDEAPMVYKPYETIMNDIKDTVEVVSVLKPLYNFKAKTKEEKWSK